MGSDISRRAAYLANEWITRLPGCGSVGRPDDYFEMVEKNLAYQFFRQSEERDKEGADDLSREVIDVLRALSVDSGRDFSERAIREDLPKKTLVDMLTVAEFLGREGRRDGR